MGKDLLGLDRYSAKLVTHNPEWIEYAESLCAEFRTKLKKHLADVQHVGSTSVPGLKAKPIVDIAAGFRDGCVIPDLIADLESLGYIYRGDAKDSGGHLFALELAHDVSSVHVHAVEYQGSQWNNYLLFRNTLRHNLMARKRYAKRKAYLANRFSSERERYTAGKHQVITDILKSATS